MKFTAIAVVSFGAGQQLGLSKDQAAAREPFLTATDRKGWYTTTGPVQFKRGEVFEAAENSLPKHMAEAMHSPELESRKAADAVKAAKAKAKGNAPAPAVAGGGGGADASTAGATTSSATDQAGS